MTIAFDDLTRALGGRYRFEREVARGAMGVVYLAEDLKHHRQVAIKVLNPDLAVELGAERFLREIEIAAQLNHPHILPLFDSGVANGLLYYVMPYVSGESLRERLNREKQIPLDDAVQIAREIAHALDYAHRRGVVHRDIKPENILLVDQQAVVADFGVCRAMQAAGGEKLTRTGIAIGTPAYMSPEQASGSEELDGRSDTYSLGCLVYEMLAGQAPFNGPTVDSVIRQHLAAEAPNIIHIRPSVPPRIAEAVNRALAKTPADRFSRAAAFAEALTRDESAEVHGAAADKRRWVVAVGAAVAVVGVAMAMSLMSGTNRAEDNEAASRVMVMPFENRTSLTDLDPLGAMVAEWVTQGLTEAPFLTVLDRSGGQAATHRLVAGATPVDAAREAGAAVVVAGSYFLQGDSLQFHSQIASTTDGSILFSIGGVVAPRSRPLDGAAQMRERVLTALASLHNKDIASFDMRFAQPPAYAAYREYTEGLELYLKTEGDAARHFEQAAALDTSFLTADLWAAQTWVGYDNAKVGPILDRVRLRHSRLTRFDRARLERLESDVASDNTRGYSAALRMLEAVPGSLDARREAAIYSMRVMRGREALQRLQELEPGRGLMRHWVDYWSASAWIHHMLGEHREELAAARRGRELSPGNGHFRLLEMRALAALGRVAELDSAARADFPAFPGRTGVTARVIAGELLAHSDSVSSRRLALYAAEVLAARAPTERTWQEWLEQHRDLTNLSGDREVYLANPLEPRDVRSTLKSAHDEWLHQRAELALLLGDPDEAERLAAQIGDPDAHRLLPARVAAALGKGAAARVAMIKAEQRYLRHWQNLRGLALDRAGVFLRLGDKDTALDILSEGLTRGLIPDSRWGNDGHARSDLAPLWSDPQFLALIKPRR